ncbi:hypothetical protein IMG5_163890 [Ichthyophthirius multifiliis]|uniref:DNA topoisomerase 2 n=1 Tax=Ichthyophthirius multifiliis TaxID=5932 RepID=G0R0E4_ICHMU|nr:hypothetical protein IMG5_163890 [Ichthyophthirius multifiliis]EGR29059.1 hypothetical protein IMG5_163890 [Ichthyophthirius multifiliis]|eukprot:XP_004030295.1 hypothetical protein IMG5_163890 [Ichthyophthirius multifiliis]
MESLTEDTVCLLKKRVYDMSGIFNTNLKVFLNEQAIKIKSFSHYINMFLPEVDESLKIYDKEMKTDRWEILLTFSDGVFKQVSFVNAICTSRGGKHVDYIVDKIVERIQEQIQKKNKDLDIKPYQIKSHIFLFVNALIVNPTFDSQTKETLTTKASQFGSKPEISEKFIKAILKTGIVEQIVNQAKARENSKLQKTLKGGKKARITGIPKLDDANDAGTARSENCTLILTEGDSAKALAMAGIEVVGRDNFGVFPLRGKLLNVREAPKKQIMDNQEIQNLCKIMGLDPSKTNYENTKSLRYGSIMIMTDQDSDGSHIKGLLINFIHYFWPSLFRMNGFLKEFVTPIIKATKGNEIHSFFTIQDFKNFATQQGNRLKQYKVKYYKGLGTSTDKEAKEYFSNVYDHQIKFLYEDDEDFQRIELGFSRKKIQERKDWLAIYNPNLFVDYNIKQLRFKDFIDKELIHFSNSDNLRSIPSVVDGLKPGQRKILFACFKRNLKNEIKVAQLQGYVAEHSAYHHGEQSLAQTIINMAQNFVGANNISLLEPIGQFGTRNQGGKEHASSRYIFTNLSPITRLIFPEPDDHSLKYLEDDSQLVEPEWYIPIIPLCLVNGSEGIGTGWSTNIPNYNHREIVEQIRNRLDGKPFTQIHPWYKGFQGTIEISNKGGYITKGKWDIDEEEETIRITELPVGKWTKDYKNYLEELINPAKDQPDLEDIREYHTNNRVDFQVQCVKGKMQSWDIEKKFKLSNTFQITNMVLFDKEHKLKRYGGTEEILEYFYGIRLELYEKRKIYLLSKLQRDMDILTNKMRFINYVVNGELELRNVKRKILIQKMAQLKLLPMKKKMKKLIELMINQDEEDKDQFEDPNDYQANEYNYLLVMPIYSLTEEKVEQLKKQVYDKEQELILLQKKTSKIYGKKIQINLLKLLNKQKNQKKRQIRFQRSNIRWQKKVKKNQRRRQRSRQISGKKI